MDGNCILIESHDTVHDIIQSYLDKIYTSFDRDIKQTLHFSGNEIYGEILYYSAIKLIKYLKLHADDHFLDIGSGLGKLALYVFLMSEVKSVTGIEINHPRHVIANRIHEIIQDKLPRMFDHRQLTFVEGDFLQSDFDHVTVVYLCSTIFSYDLLENIGRKLNSMSNVKKIASFRKIPYLSNFNLLKKILIHCSWERVGCYVYERKV